MNMAAKKTGSESGKTKKAETQKSKRIEVALAPALYRLIDAERTQRNSSPETTGDVTSYSDIVNEALHSFLPKVDS